MPGSYHRFVFNESTREFIGDFESMYQTEESEGFDSWHQDELGLRVDVTMLEHAIANAQYLLAVDIGCGKGALTSRLVRYASRVVGLDVSPTAIRTASERYPSITFRVADIGIPQTLASELESLSVSGTSRSLIVLSQVLSYLCDWQGALEKCLATGADLAVALYLPSEPIGYVKNIDSVTKFLEREGRSMTHFDSGISRQHVVISRSTDDWVTNARI